MPNGICIWDSLGRMYNGPLRSGELGLSAAEALGWGTGSEAGTRCRASYLCLQLGAGAGGRTGREVGPSRISHREVTSSKFCHQSSLLHLKSTMRNWGLSWKDKQEGDSSGSHVTLGVKEEAGNWEKEKALSGSDDCHHGVERPSCRRVIRHCASLQKAHQRVGIQRKKISSLFKGWHF